MIQRIAAEQIQDALEDTPVVLITGPRQCGKSTLANQFVAHGRQSVTLDDPDAFGLAKTNPKAFLKTYTAPLLIDEIQRAPELFLSLKAEVDKNRTPGAYLLTGSSNILTLPKVADSLAGRMEVVDLAPFSQAELEGVRRPGLLPLLFGERSAWSGGPSDGLWGRVAKGGFPEPALRDKPARRAAWFQSYVRAILDRDVRDLAQIEGLAHLPRLLQQLAQRVGQTLNLSTLAVETGIPYTSLKRYLALLEKVFLLQPLSAWSFEDGKQLAKAPKAYLCDTGLLCHILNLDEEFLARDPHRALPVLRGFAVQEVRKLAASDPVRPQAMHLRTVRHSEVDIVLEDPSGRVAGISVTANPSASLSDLQGLKWLQDLAGDRFVGGAVLHTGEDFQPLAPQLWSVPFSSLWS